MNKDKITIHMIDAYTFYGNDEKAACMACCLYNTNLCGAGEGIDCGSGNLFECFDSNVDFSNKSVEDIEIDYGYDE